MNFEAEEELILREAEKLHLNLAVEDSGAADGLKDMVIRAGGFDVQHISGHAGIDDKKGPVFYMENEIGWQDKVTPNAEYQLMAVCRMYSDC
ncbi:hypothetical protein QUF90_08660 [Desulfococcaceae bacterium HSG9]|nr:hypothetical protein [Desulfococcaceae bacterium HSG9]